MTAMDPTLSAPEGDSSWFFNHLPRILWDRRFFIAVSTVLIWLAALIAAFMLPTLYRSQATLLVQAQDLPTDIVSSPSAGTLDQRIAKLRERVLSRSDLISLIEQNNLYPKERASKPLSTVIEKMREATSISALEGNIGQPRSGQSDTIAVTMTFDYPDPATAQSVLQSFVTSFLKTDADDAETQANLSVRFLEDQARELQGQIRQIEGQLTELKARNGAALAAGGSIGMIDTGSYTAQIASLESQNRQLLAAQDGTGPNGTVVAAERALAAAKAKYSDNHPDVIAAQEQLRQAKAFAAQQVAGASDLIMDQVRANNKAIAELRANRDATMARASAAAAGSARAPAIMEQAMQLENRANGLRDQYREVSANLLKAQNSARMVDEQRAERLSLIDAPNLPDEPNWPNRPLLVLAGLAGGLMVGLFGALVMEFVVRPLRSPAQIEASGLPVIGVVPLLTNEARKLRLRDRLPWRRKMRARYG